MDAKGRVLSEKCIADEIPFKIPESWAWTRMESILEFINGRAYKKSELLTSGKYPVLRVGNLFTSSTWYYSDLELASEKYCHNGDLLYAWSASFGPTIWLGPDCIFHYHIWNVKHSEFVDRAYLYWALLQDVVRVKQATTGSAMIHVSMEHMKPRFLPIPPLAEQRRIVERVSQLMPLVEEYGELEDAREVLDAALPGRLCKSVLQMAVQGKLVPQDPTDEPASALLERIREQRRRLVAEKKMKAPKGGESVIFTGSDGRRYEKRVDAKGRESEPVCIEEEIPFEIPDGWEWARLESVIILLSGTDLKPFQYNDKKEGIPYLTGASNFADGKLIENRWTIEPSRISNKGELLFTCKGTVGEMAINQFDAAHIARQIMSITPCEYEMLPYITLFLKAMVEDIKSHAKGVIPGIERNTLLARLIPVPPLAEQNQIAEKSAELFDKIA